MQYFSVHFTLPSEKHVIEHITSVKGNGGVVFRFEWDKFRQEYPEAVVESCVMTWDDCPVDDW